MQHRDSGISVSPDHRGVNSSDVQSANDQKRRCRVIKKGERCKTFLSRYNHGDICHACEEQIVRGLEYKLAPAERAKTPKKKRGKKTDSNAANEAPCATETTTTLNVAVCETDVAEPAKRVAESEMITATAQDLAQQTQTLPHSSDAKSDPPAPKSLRPEAQISP